MGERGLQALAHEDPYRLAGANPEVGEAARQPGGQVAHLRKAHPSALGLDEGRSGRVQFGRGLEGLGNVEALGDLPAKSGTKDLPRQRFQLEAHTSLCARIRVHWALPKYSGSSSGPMSTSRGFDP